VLDLGDYASGVEQDGFRKGYKKGVEDMRAEFLKKMQLAGISESIIKKVLKLKD
jgi:flagellar biosynthesis/type III secretory pathway protein FliH